MFHLYVDDDTPPPGCRHAAVAFSPLLMTGTANTPLYAPPPPLATIATTYGDMNIEHGRE